MHALRSVLPCVAATAVATALVACDSDPTGIPLPSGAREFTPPAVYARWLAQVRQCSATPGGGGGLRWFVVDGDFVPVSGRDVSGYYDLGANRIVIAGNALFDGAAVRHEMLHAVRRTAGHARRDFLEACGGLVTCEESCVADAGPPPPVPAGAVIVPLQEMPVSLELAPAVVSMSSGDGFLSATVVVRNVRDVPVVVQTPTPWGGPDSRGFGFVAGSETRSEWLDEPTRDSSLLRFAPREVKRWQVDLRASAFGDGELRVRGHYLRRFTETVRGEVRP